jgi:hypothetical protein
MNLVLTIIGGTLLIGLGVGLIFGWVLLLGWILFVVYRAIAPESWPYLGLWPATGIMLLASLIFSGGSSRAVKE